MATEPQDFIIPSSPADRKALMAGIREIDGAMTRKQAEADFIKESIGELSGKFGIPKKLLRKYATSYHKANIAAAVGEIEQLTELHNALTGDHVQ